MPPLFKFVTSSGSKRKEPWFACLSEAKTSHSHRTWTEVSSSVPRLKFACLWVPKHGPQICMSKKGTLQVPCKGAPPPPRSPAWSLWREMLCLQSLWFIHSCISVGSPQKGVLPRDAVKIPVTVSVAPRGRKACVQWGVAWFPKRIANDIALTTRVPCSVQHDTFHHSLGRPRAPLASMCHSNPQKGYTLHIS